MLRERHRYRMRCFPMVWALWMNLSVEARNIIDVAVNNTNTSLGMETESDGGIRHYTDTSLGIQTVNEVVRATVGGDENNKRGVAETDGCSTGERKEWTSPGQIKDDDTTLGPLVYSESTLENEDSGHGQNLPSISNNVSRSETVAHSTNVSHPHEVVEDWASCRHKCGQIQPFPCSCDLKCLIHKNCCEDMSVMCPEILRESGSRYGHLQHMKLKCSEENVFVITECRNRDATESVQMSDTHGAETGIGSFTLSEDAITNIKYIIDAINNAYVTDTTTGFVYKNQEVFSCATFNTSNSAKWSVTFQSRSLNHATSLQDILDNIRWVQTSQNSPPLELEQNLTGAPCIQQAIDTCLDDWLDKDPDTVAKCRQFISYVSLGYSVFRNKYCLLCNGLSLANTTIVSSQSSSQRTNFRFSLIMSLSGSSLKVIAKERSTTFEISACKLTDSTYSSLGHDRDVCSNDTCDVKSTRRPDGVCKQVFVMIIAVSDDGYPFSREEYQTFPQFVKCFIKSHITEIDTDDELFPTVPVFDSRLNIILYTTRTFIYNEELPQGQDQSKLTAQLYRLFSTMSRELKVLRKSKAKASGPLQHEQTGLDLPKISSVKLMDSFRLQLKGYNYSDTSGTTTCLCIGKFPISVSNYHNACNLECLQTADMAENATVLTLKPASKCFSVFNSQSRTIGHTTVCDSLFCWLLIIATTRCFI